LQLSQPKQITAADGSATFPFQFPGNAGIGQYLAVVSGFMFEFSSGKPQNILDIGIAMKTSVSNNTVTVTVAQTMQNDESPPVKLSGNSWVAIVVLALPSGSPAGALTGTLRNNIMQPFKLPISQVGEVNSGMCGWASRSADGKDHQINSISVISSNPVIVAGSTNKVTGNVTVNIGTDDHAYDTTAWEMGLIATASTGSGFGVKVLSSVVPGSSFEFDYDVDQYVILLQSFTTHSSGWNHQPVTSIVSKLMTGEIDGKSVTVSAGQYLQWKGTGSNAYGGNVSALCVATYKLPTS